MGSKGYVCMPEISREIIKDAQTQGIEQLFLTNPLLFSQKLLEGRLLQYKTATTYYADYLFYDRGMPDVTSYMDYIGAWYPHKFAKTIQAYKYDLVFLLPPWKEIYVQDNERYESFEQSQKIYTYLKKGYAIFGYETIEVPAGTLEEREQFIIHYLSDIF